MPRPRVEGNDSGSITCISEGVEPEQVRCRRGVNRLDGSPETRRECRAEAVQRPQMMSGESDHLHARIARRSVYEAHDPTGEPGAGNRHAGFGEQGLET